MRVFHESIKLGDPPQWTKLDKLQQCHKWVWNNCKGECRNDSFRPFLSLVLSSHSWLRPCRMALWEVAVYVLVLGALRQQMGARVIVKCCQSICFLVFLRLYNLFYNCSPKVVTSHVPFSLNDRTILYSVSLCGISYQLWSSLF